MVKNVIKLGAVALLLLGITLCATFIIEDNCISAMKLGNDNDIYDDNKLNGVQPIEYIFNNEDTQNSR